MKRNLSKRVALFLLPLACSAALAACTTITAEPAAALKPNTQWVATSPGWQQEAEAVYDEATLYIKKASADWPEKNWAVILDLDETVLNNVAYQISRETLGKTYSPESWFDWTQKEQATLVPGAAQFITAVNQQGGHVAFVTNRRDNEQLATESNLAALGLKRGQDFRILLTKASPDGSSDKTARFNLIPAMLAAQGYMDVKTRVFIGDNIGDKPSVNTGWKFFCIDQGAMYGDPCAAIPGPGR